MLYENFSLLFFRWPTCGRILLFLDVIVVVFFMSSLAHAQIQGPSDVQASKLLNMGKSLSERSHYLESLDLFEEARDILETSGMDNTALYSDVLHEMAKTKIKARLHQNFPAQYVRTALEDVQLSNRVWEKLSGASPQSLAEGYYLEGYIHKKFFMRMDQARSSFLKALRVDPASVAAKRELSELISSQENREGKE